jgi:hypothetical protein
MKVDEKQEVRINVKNFQDSVHVMLELTGPKGCKITPNQLEVHINGRQKEEWYTVTVEAGKNAQSGSIAISGKAISSNAVGMRDPEVKSYTEIAYDHIPTQVIFRKAEIECKLLDIKIRNGKIAYIKGVEDAVPQAIEQLGFEVDLFEVSDIPNINFNKYQSVVLGIRIFNVHPELSNYTDRLNEYVKNGGNVVMQYNTASRTPEKGVAYGPYSFELSRNRVTEEDAAVKFLAPKHPIMTTPNVITEKDFENWVQERGLYFAANWDENFTPLFSWADKGEEAQTGALIVAKYGKGQFIYTGISFFRELPNGVVGAYRLFANILSYQP